MSGINEKGLPCYKTNLKKYLSKNLADAIFKENSPDCLHTPIFEEEGTAAFLNHDTCGRPFAEVQWIADELRQLGESNPDLFYKKICPELTSHTYQVTARFLASHNISFVQNCTVGTRCILEKLTKKTKNLRAAYLWPISEETRNLLQSYSSEKKLSELFSISPLGNQYNALIEENPEIILHELVNCFNICKFDVLFCDETASFSGRILPIKAVSKFCRKNNVILVIDATQTCQLFFETNLKEILEEVDYFLMDTHKWLGNIKTCAIIRCSADTAPPNLPTLSFGYLGQHFDRKDFTTENRVKQLCMQKLDFCIACSALGKAIQLFLMHGEALIEKASKLLSHGLKNLIKVEPLLPTSSNRLRVVNIFSLKNALFESMPDALTIQNALQDYGLYVSVEAYGDIPVFNGDGGMAVKSSKTRFYVRISCWAYNIESDFRSASLALTNNIRLIGSTNQAFVHQFTFAYDLYEKLFSVLKPEAFFIRAEPLRHPLVFYYGHTSVFYVNKLILSRHLSKRIDPELEADFSVGVDEKAWDKNLRKNSCDWCELSKVQQIQFLEKIANYREKVRKTVLMLIHEKSLNEPIVQGSSSFHRIVLMGIEHEMIHLETSAVIIAQVPISLLNACHDFNFPSFFNENIESQEKVNFSPENAPINSLIPVEGGTVCMGKDFIDGDLFGWDNEFGHEMKFLENFEVSQMLVSNAEYLKFIEDGGYAERGKKWWSADGWQYVTDTKVTGPKFWIGRTRHRFLLEEVPMPWNFPVMTNNLEAEAFCNWKSERMGKPVRLISYEECFHMRSIAKNELSNNNLKTFGSPSPVNFYSGEIGGRKIFDISGNVWRHTVSALTVMDGFKIDPFYDDYTLPFIDGNHNHITGGSWISMGGYANLNTRSGFRRHFYQFCGIRYVCSKNDFHKLMPKSFHAFIGMHITEHYGSTTGQTLQGGPSLENWPMKFGEMAAEIISSDPMPHKDDEVTKVMVVHGSVGRTTLELLRRCENLHVDHTEETANTLQVLEILLEKGKIQWCQPVEGEIGETMTFLLGETESNGQLLAKNKNSVSFWQVDYGNLKGMLNNYDFIVADFKYENFARHVTHLTKRLRIGGTLILGSVYDFSGPDIVLSDDPKLELTKFYVKINRKKSYTKCAHICRFSENKVRLIVSSCSVWKKIGNHIENPLLCDASAQVFDPSNLLAD